MSPDFVGLQNATAHLQPPFAVIDRAALLTNADDMVRRANGTPIRLASKSVRCREIMRSVLKMDGYQGILAFTLPEAIWLADDFDDVLVAYPTVDTDALRQLASDAHLAAKVTIMVDSIAHLDFLTATVGTDGTPLRLCLDLDASLEYLDGRVHIGARRSPLHTPDQAAALTREIVSRKEFRLVGLMCYEAQIAGVGDDAPGPLLRRLAIRAMQHVSGSELRDRRAAVVDAVRAIAPLEFVNGGGTGTLETTSAETAVTELGAGSGLYGPALFDTYRHFKPLPAAFFVLSVVRRPTPEIATVLGGGWIASGAAGPDRLPTPAWPEGLGLIAAEGAGEVQTPLQGPGAADLAIGDRVWFRHTKAGELCEHADVLHFVEDGRIVESLPTYRGEGKIFA
ncbi:amino acid deaminase/aldolase [Antrihabitans stalactiti]|uniref:Amino acid deaminase/aldolase n=1 Tax=Antrihabitans stalactiti TaxID=2584121 RepID=A0A848KI68_9NOCA|nr:amino acid deaminase/aldolase [Antrihabitans stalactiti]NMN95930.1 amino acid deaminase/aldolase [Antrihabitans stalactiti]